MTKMKKQLLIICIVFFTVILYFLANPLQVQASTAGDNVLNQITSGSNTFMQMGQNKLNTMGVSINMNLITGIAQVLYFAGCVIVIALTIYKAVKYGMSSPGDRASLKKELAGWIIVCILLIGAYPLYKLIASAIDNSSYTSNVISQLKNTAQGLTATSQNSTFMLIINTIFRVIQVGAIGYIIIRFTVVGIKYFTTSAASEKAVEKGELVRTLILAIVIFGAAGFFEIIYQALN